MLAEDVFALFDLLLQDTSLRHSRRARPIVFELANDGVWSFEPRSPGGFFAPGDVGGAALRVRCRLELLLALLTKDGYRLTADEPFDFQGELDALQPIIEALRNGGSPLAVRAAAQP